MGWLTSKYGHFTYKEPERLDPIEARQRRLFAELSRQRRALEAQPARLSPANISHLQRLKEFQSKFGAELDARRKSVAAHQKAAQRDPSILRSFAYKAAISEFLQLRQRQSALAQRASQERRSNASKTPVADRRFFSFMDKYIPRTAFGTEAWTRLEPVDHITARSFRNPLLAIPCIQRAVRREVMFAQRSAGRGYRKPHRRNPLSDIWC